ncbi:MAG: AmpG family muropeptide MFS transporter [Magnetovibrionaceae bacterium]
MTKSWGEALAVYADRRVMTLLFLGFSSGLPLLLVFSTLSVWLKFEGVSLTAIGLFSLVRTPYTFKFLWAPLVDRLPLPFLTRRFGRRRGWALLAQVLLMAAIAAMAMTKPGIDPWWTALFAVIVAFASATQDIVIDAYRVESLKSDEQGAGAGVLVMGYRIGMLTAGAGALWLAAILSWNEVYLVMAALVLIGVITVLVSKEPRPEELPENPLQSGWGSWFSKAVVAPFADFLTRPGWLLILAFILFYKMGDAYLGVMANPFYVEMGFSTVEIANVSKIFGLGATIAGGLFGGLLVARFGLLPALLVCGILQAASNLVFAWQATQGHDVGALMITIATENLTGGMATAAFVAYLSALCSLAYTATQYALLSSVMAVARDVLAASSGWLADQVSWFDFFLISTGVALPGLLLLVIIIRRYPPPSHEDNSEGIIGKVD